MDLFLAARHRAGLYNCVHFARDVWLEITGEDLTGRLGALLGPASTRRVEAARVRGFSALGGPEDPCLVLMRRRRCAPHVGVYLRGRVLHLHERGAEYQPVEVAMRGFQTVRYFR